jgi:hypothetical protein
MGKLAKGAIVGFACLVLVALGAAAVAEVVPLYPPLECDLAPEIQHVFLPDIGWAFFDGNWAGGPDGVYESVKMSYGDGHSESWVNVTYTSDSFDNQYDLSGKDRGYRWYPKLTVKNGGTVSDTVIVEIW